MDYDLWMLSQPGGPHDPELENIIEYDFEISKINLKAEENEILGTISVKDLNSNNEWVLNVIKSDEWCLESVDGDNDPDVICELKEFIEELLN